MFLPWWRSDPRSYKCLPHVNPYVALSVGYSTNPSIKGLGLYALGGAAKDTVLCMFTGAWAFESDVDAVFALDDPCVQNYGSTYGKHMTVIDSRTLRMDGRCDKLVVDRLVAMPRLRRGGPTGCRLLYDVRSGICDIGGLINGASAGSKANCKLQHAAVMLPAGDDNEKDAPDVRALGQRLEPHAAIAVVATEDILALAYDSKEPTELILDYGYDPANPGTADRFKRKPWDSRRYELKDREWQQGLRYGASIAATIPGAISWATAGPRLKPVPCGTGATAVTGLVAYQDTGPWYQNYLRKTVVGDVPLAPRSD